jgi:hypothetical protein
MHLIHSAQNFSHFAKKSACGIRTLHQTILLVKGRTLALNGSFQKTSIPPPQRKLEVNPPPPSDVLIHLLLSETILSPLPLRMAEISSVGGVWIFSGTTHFRKHPYHPHGGNWKLTPPTPFGCPNTFTIIRNNFVSHPPPDGSNFLCGGSVDLFWNDSMG